MVVAFELDGELVGTIRAVPMGKGLTLVEKLRAQAGVESGDTHARGWEMGRLAINPDYRGGPESLRGFLYLSLSYLHRISAVDNLHATCTPVLSRLYRRFGFAVVARDVPLLGTSKTYTLIHGYFNHVIGELARGEEAPRMGAALTTSRFDTIANQGAFT
ncbi:MAG: N-acetyltransferase [Ramlibacter sp.]|nr:N-acetyltransferase [Ramlibacter sp.]